MHTPKRSGGRPKHVAVYEQGKKAQTNFAAAMRSILNPPKPAVVSPKRPNRVSGN
jgi:hypothetical protein